MSRLFTMLIIAFCSLTQLGFSLNQDAKKMTENTKNPVVLIKTNKGFIKAELYADKAPISVKNFLDYATANFYDGTVFHRVIPGFMVQGGGFTPNFEQKKTNAPIKNEAGNGVKNTRGTLAMARTSDVNSATAQFFINVSDNDFLNYRSDKPAEYGYAVFGKVTEGMDVVDAIVKVKTGSYGPHRDVPTEPVVIEGIVIAQPK
jgi:cyclophilin family peptidyl-prolyl cis-trans isomerase